MSQSPIQITADQTNDAENDRFHRFKLIGWWDQKKLADAKVLVIGAGALGNEILKNLALLGIGNVLVADLDRIENSNLSRSVLYRAKDNGKFKADVAAVAAKDIYPDMKTHSFNGNVVYDLGMGVFRWADVIIGGLDNREARLAINRAAWRVKKPWVDGAIEQIQGIARVFSPIAHPDGPCYECTMSETDWKLLANRRSCNLLTRSEMQQGKTPTTPTISSIIAGVQCQEAVKLLHGMDSIAGKGWCFAGLSADSYSIDYQAKEECYSHDILHEIISIDGSASNITAKELLALAKKHLGPDAELELARDVLEKMICPKCKTEEPVFTSLGKAKSDLANCPNCPGVRREVTTFFKIRGNEPFINRPLSEIGVPAFDIIIARNKARSIGFELSADAGAVLGELHQDESGLTFE